MAKQGGGPGSANAQPKRKGFISGKYQFLGCEKMKETQQTEVDTHKLHASPSALPGYRHGTLAGRRTSVPPSDESEASGMQPQRSQTFSNESPRTARPVEVKQPRKKKEEKRQQKDAAKQSRNTAAPKRGLHGPTLPSTKDRPLEAAPLFGSSGRMGASQLGERVVSYYRYLGQNLILFILSDVKVACLPTCKN